MPMNEFFDFRSTSDNESKLISFKSETVRPVISTECLYCDRKTIACTMGLPCASRDSLRFCGLPGREAQ